MNQLAIDFASKPVPAPNPDTLCGRLLAALMAGERLTPLSALERYQCLSLSQRMGGLRRMGYPVQSEMVTVASGKRVALYWMAK